MGAKKTRRAQQKLDRRQPWTEVVIRTRGGGLIQINCPACRTRCAIRYWDHARRQAVCIGCVPRAARQLIPSQASNPATRPMALD